VPLGNRRWIDTTLPRPERSLAKAKDLLAAAHFSWTRENALKDPNGKPVEFSIMASSGNAERLQMATMIQADLQQLGMSVHVVPLEMRSLVDRVQRTHDYEACLLSFASADADPNPDMGIWLSNGANHVWNPEQKAPATAWEAEIDSLMHRQMVTRDHAERKRLFDRVQQLAMENLPLIPLLSPNILVGAKAGLGNFRPAVMDHYTLWNIDELYWRAPGTSERR
jgi:peptide/nickel transport system substrate-binding protein